MSGLLEAAEVVRVPTVRSDAFDAVGCVLRSQVSNVCSPIVRDDLSGSEGDGSAPDKNLFAVLTSMKSRAQCSPGTEEKMVGDALDMESEKAAGRVLFGSTGDNAGIVSLAAPTVGTVATGASARASLVAALQEFWTRATGVSYEDTLVHLGVGSLLELFGEVENSLIKNLDIKVATSAGYPTNAIAVTGPIRVELGPDEVLQSHDTTVNDIVTEASRLGALEFDPCIAVRVA